MDFRLDDQQLALQGGIAEFCADRYPLDTAGRWQSADRSARRVAFRELGGLGVFSIMVPEADGGLGLGVTDAALVFEQLGRFLVPGPLVWSTVAARLAPGADGPAAVGGLMAPANGEPVLVEHAVDIDALVVIHADRAELVGATDLDGAEPLDPLDPLTPVGRHHRVPTGQVVGNSELADDLRHQATVLTAALATGVAQAALDLARDYALERHQFDRPIASFQALKHMMADMYVRTGLARSSTYAAAAVLDDPVVGHRERAVSGAKLLAGEAAGDNARAAIQILGGMGFTWEMPTNLMLKRAWVLEQSLGSATEHALAISDSLAGAA
jgi:alkylation response protein AidB-like acyl-CoA dehydrogenase